MRRLWAVVVLSLVVIAGQAQDFPPGALLYAPLPEPGVARLQRSGTDGAPAKVARLAANRNPGSASAGGRPAVASGTELRPSRQTRVIEPVPPVPATACSPEGRALALCGPTDGSTAVYRK